MNEPAVIVWDLETVPDLRAAARILGIEYESDEQVRAAMGSSFPKHPLHSIACIGALVARREEKELQQLAPLMLKSGQSPSLFVPSSTGSRNSIRNS
jgi:hypothetical protein